MLQGACIANRVCSRARWSGACGKGEAGSQDTSLFSWPPHTTSPCEEWWRAWPPLSLRSSPPQASLPSCKSTVKCLHRWRETVSLHRHWLLNDPGAASQSNIRSQLPRSLCLFTLTFVNGLDHEDLEARYWNNSSPCRHVSLQGHLLPSDKTLHWIAV